MVRVKAFWYTISILAHTVDFLTCVFFIKGNPQACNSLGEKSLVAAMRTRTVPAHGYLDFVRYIFKNIRYVAIQRFANQIQMFEIYTLT